MLETEYKYFIDHRDELVNQYENKYLVLIGEEIIGVYSSDEEAYFETIKNHKPGTFLIQFCSKDESSYTEIYHSRVTF